MGGRVVRPLGRLRWSSLALALALAITPANTFAITCTRALGFDLSSNSLSSAIPTELGKVNHHTVHVTFTSNLNDHTRHSVTFAPS